ncbi:MAG: glycoside hydrolase, partial [Actinomycetota bacterium]|nr:glycoside hydrolase [Actinomycetota bacterium]
GTIPLVQPNGHVTVVWDDFIYAYQSRVMAKTSRDGGRTFGPQVKVTDISAGFIRGMRTGPPGGFPAAAADPVSGDLYVAWQDGRLRPKNKFGGPKGSDILVSSSSDGGRSWSSPVRANHDPLDDRRDHFLPAVAAYGGDVHVSYLTRHWLSNFIRERSVSSTNGGESFGVERKLARRGDLSYAATVCTGCGTRWAERYKFVGDYMAIAAARKVAYAVWARPAKPATGPRARHQTIWSGMIAVKQARTPQPVH